MMNRCIVVFLLLTNLSLALGGVQQNAKGVVKSLPLDGVPRVTMKTRANSFYMHDRIIIKMMPRVAHSLSKSAFGVSSIDQALSRISVVSTQRMFPTASFKTDNESEDLALFYFVTFSSPNDPFALAEELSKLPEVQYAEPWFIYSVSKDIQTAPNDPSYGQQWGLTKTKAEQAWDIAKGDSTVIIAIVDSGVEWQHPDLAANIWINPKEIPGNGIDDDGNGKVDDVHGWDLVGSDYHNFFEDNDPAPTGDNNNHGTHVAGIAAAVTNNAIGIASISYNCKILPVKCTADNDDRSGGNGYILTGYQGIVYAAQMGTAVINCSWGGAGGSQAEQDIINTVTKQGSLVVAAAGNGATDEFYSPAAYKNVLAVAATDQKDSKALFSNYGDYVDVCAPGVDIFSTIFRTPAYPTGYTIFSGTSMATPLTAGLVALVKSTPAFKNYTPLQLGEQVRVTCDSISDNTSGFYAGKLGRGRINAAKAVTVINLPSVRMQSFAITDTPGGNGNDVPQPGEILSIKCSFRNFLAPTSSNAQVELKTLNSYITVQSGTFQLGTINTLDSTNNNASPFSVYVDPLVPASYAAVMQVTVIDGSFTDSQTFSFLVNPTYQTTSVNAIQLTLTNNGKLGFFDFPTNTLGMGLIFNGANHLFEGGLIIGTSSSKLVDVVRNTSPNAQDEDFSSSNFYSLITPGVLSQQDGFTTFSDSAVSTANQVGVRVNMYSYAFSTPEDSRYIILRYDIKNTTSTTLTNLYAGIFLDWDLGTANANFSRYDSTRSLGYAYDSGTGARREYVGIRALDSAASYVSLDRDFADLTRAGKWNWLSGGFGNTDMGPTDVHHVISSGPYTLSAGATQTIGFALVVGDSSLANIQTNADAAKAKWIALRRADFLPVSVSEEKDNLPRVFGLSQNYPNPFNSTTSFELRVASSEFVSLKVFDLLGREIAVLMDERKSPGTYKITWDASHLSSGVYLYRMTAGSFVETKKLVLMR